MNMIIKNIIVVIVMLTVPTYSLKLCLTLSLTVLIMFKLMKLMKISSILT